MPDGEGPLAPADLDEIKRRLADLDRVDRLIEQAMRGGIDIADQRKRSQELRDQLTRIRQSFFPGQ